MNSQTQSTLPLGQRSQSFTDKKIQDFSMTSQDPREKFSTTFSEPVNV